MGKKVLQAESDKHLRRFLRLLLWALLRAQPQLCGVKRFAAFSQLLQFPAECLSGLQRSPPLPILPFSSSSSLLVLQTPQASALRIPLASEFVKRHSPSAAPGALPVVPRARDAASCAVTCSTVQQRAVQCAAQGAEGEQK